MDSGTEASIELSTVRRLEFGWAIVGKDATRREAVDCYYADPKHAAAAILGFTCP